MKVKFYGVRGSLPMVGQEFQRYGGNTTCICITRETANRMIILDAGTGIRKLGKELVTNGSHQDTINLSFTHFHWDHIQGFPFFAPAYDKNKKIKIHTMGSQRKFTNIKQIFSMQMQSEYFPVELDAMGAQLEFCSFGDNETFSNANVVAAPQHHKFPGGSYGFRMEDESGILVICTDVEHFNGIDSSIVELAKNADLLIHDGQYTDAEYKKFKGWGHSSWRQAIEVAKMANVKQLIITHHDPDHNDDFLDAMEAECKNEFPDCLMAKEGMEITI